MRILGYKPDHDGTLCSIADGVLEFSLETEKNSKPRHACTKPEDWLHLLAQLPAAPDVIAVSGWHFDAITRHAPAPSDAAYGYMGVRDVRRVDYTLWGRRLSMFASTHERSHLLCSYGLSPWEQGRPCYALIWEGNIGAFYKIGPSLEIEKVGEPLVGPGLRYAYLYYLASAEEKTFTYPGRYSSPGKVMALASYGQDGSLDEHERAIIDYLLSPLAFQHLKNPTLTKAGLPLQTPFMNIGVEDQRFKNLARKFSDIIFSRFYDFARTHLTERLPLLIGGGCGLNCEWNTLWREVGLFPEVFVPPCTNDSGSALGTAIDAQFHFTGNAKISWTPYAGEPFMEDQDDCEHFTVERLDLDEVAAWLERGLIVAWAQGRYEMGPRALGHRSLLAAPFDRSMTDRLNKIKQREGFRPIAPICLAEDVKVHFDWSGESPHMLYFQAVKDARLKAIAHVDGTARVQTVSAAQSPRIHALLDHFKRRTGVGVLCNTSLNFSGRGFINRASDLFRYAIDHDVNAVVIGDKMYLKRRGLG